MSETVRYETRHGIAYVTLHRPHKLNTFNLEMSAALRDAWERFAFKENRRPRFTGC